MPHFASFSCLLGTILCACTGEPRCVEPGHAIVTDIDGTLTTGDNEFLLQILDGNYDPAERPFASELMKAYSERGYYVVYLTARLESLTLGFTGETARDATARWLFLHDFPVGDDRTGLQLSPALVFGDAAGDYKGGALLELEAAGFVFDFAYGNAPSDITA